MYLRTNQALTQISSKAITVILWNTLKLDKSFEIINRIKYLSVNSNM